MADAPGQKRILLDDDLCCDFQDRLGPLIQAFGQPVRRLKAVDQKCLVLLTVYVARNLCKIFTVHQNSGQGLRIELNFPGAVRSFADKNIRYDGLYGAAFYGMQLLGG